VCAASYAVVITDLMCLGPTVQKPAADSWMSRGCFMLDYYTLIRPEFVKSVEKLTIGSRPSFSAVGNKFSLHME
jgi:hypothetical protein